MHIDKRRIIGYAAGILAGARMAVGIAICVAAVVFMILKPGKKVR